MQNGCQRELNKRSKLIIGICGGGVVAQLCHLLPKLASKRLVAEDDGHRLYSLLATQLGRTEYSELLPLQLPHLEAAFVRRQVGLSDGGWRQLRDVMPDRLPSLHHVKKAERAVQPAFQQLEGVQDSCALADPLALVRRDLLHAHGQEPLARRSLVHAGWGLDGYSLSQHNGKTVYLTAASCNIICVNGR